MTLTFMMVEIIIGLISNSLALLADAGHMANDVFSLFLAMVAIRLARRKDNVQMTYGYKRAEVLAAFINGLTLFLIVAFIFIEAIKRLSNIQALEVDGISMGVGAVAGLIVNIIGFLILNRGEKNLNIQAALHHIVADMLGSIAAIITAISIIWFRLFWMDIVTSIIISMLILKSGYTITKQSLRVLIEASPEGVDMPALFKDLHDIEGLLEIHDFHCWRLTDDNDMITAHILVDETYDVDLIRKELETVAKSYGFDHTTFQLERINCRDKDGNCLYKKEGYLTN